MESHQVITCFGFLFSLDAPHISPVKEAAAPLPSHRPYPVISTLYVLKHSHIHCKLQHSLLSRFRQFLCDAHKYKIFQ